MMQRSSRQWSYQQTLMIRNECQLSRISQSPNQSGSKTKRSRAGKPKTKTGCFTCRARRVKCDETKPKCQRCTKFGVVCDGFPKQPEGAVAPVISRHHMLQALRPKDLVQIPRHRVSGIQCTARFESDRELRYFRIFCEETASQIAGPFKSSLWGKLVPQASELEPFVRHAMVAIGAMARISQDVRNSPAPQERSQSQYLDFEHQFALKQYDKALKGMRDATVRGKNDLSIALIACLLAFCLETLQGRQGPACTLAISGLALFHQLTGRNGGHDVCLWGRSGTSCTLEDELVKSFASLDIQVLFFLDGRPLDLHQRIIDEATEVLEAMPLQFSTLDEARFYSQIIMRRNFHFKTKAQSTGKAAALGGKKKTLTWTETADFPAGEIPFSKIKDPSPDIQAEAQKYIRDTHRWSDTATMLFKSIPRSDQTSIVISALLQIHAKMSLITLAGMTFTDELSFDAFLPDFRAIANLASSIHPYLIKSSQNSGLYHFDLGMLPALYLVGTRCRDKTVRAKAIDLLYASPYREGIWDSGAIAAISNWIRHVEVGLNGGNEEFIPELKRVFLTSANVDLYNRRAKVYGTQRTGPADEDLAFMENLISW